MKDHTIDYSIYSKFITQDGSQIHYLDIGSGPAILFGHSFLWDHRMWDEQIKSLSIKYRCIVPDLWGHGKSGPLPESYKSLEDLALSYQKFMNAIEIKKYAVIGLSVGGMWGAYLASLYPANLYGLVIMDSYLAPEGEATKHQYFLLIDQVSKAGFTPALAKFTAPFFFKTNNPEQQLLQMLEGRLMDFDKDTQIPSIAALGKMIFSRPNFMHTIVDAKKAGVDIEIMVGEQDGPRPPSEAKEMASLIGKQPIIIKDSGHISTIEQPEETTKVLERVIGNMIIVNEEL